MEALARRDNYEEGQLNCNTSIFILASLLFVATDKQIKGNYIEFSVNWL